MALVDVFMPNEFEARGITGETDLDKCLVKLKDFVTVPNAVVIITAGELGVFCIQNELKWHVPASTKSIFKDSCGAGDAFNAGFLSEWIYSKDALESSKKGAAAGAVGVEYLGACDTLVTEKLLLKHKNVSS